MDNIVMNSIDCLDCIDMGDDMGDDLGDVGIVGDVTEEAQRDPRWLKNLTMNQIALNKKRITVELDYCGEGHDCLCAICLLDMHRQVVKHTPCGHTFHLTCLNKLMASQAVCRNKCPYCRHKIIAPDSNGNSTYSFYFTGSNGRSQVIRHNMEDSLDSDDLITNLMNDIIIQALRYVGRMEELEESENNVVDIDSEDSSDSESEMDSSIESDRELDDEILLGDIDHST